MVVPPTGMTVVHIPRSRVQMKGIFTTGVTPSMFTAQRMKPSEIKNWKMSLAAGVSPRERAWAMLEMSSTSPKSPVRSTAPKSR